MSSTLTIAYLSFSVPAVAAGSAVTHLGLRETAEIYGASVIVVAVIALALSARLSVVPPTDDTHQVTAAVNR